MSIERYSYIETNTQRQKPKWGTGRWMWVQTETKVGNRKIDVGIGEIEK